MVDEKEKEMAKTIQKVFEAPEDRTQRGLFIAARIQEGWKFVSSVDTILIMEREEPSVSESGPGTKKLLLD